MKKKEVISIVANRCNMEESKVKSVLQGLQDVSLEALRENKTVSISNFITLKTINVPKRSCMSSTGVFNIPAHKTIRATVSNQYKNLLAERNKGLASLSVRQKIEGILFVIALVSAAIYFFG